MVIRIKGCFDSLDTSQAGGECFGVGLARCNLPVVSYCSACCYYPMSVDRTEVGNKLRCACCSGRRDQ